MEALSDPSTVVAMLGRAVVLDVRWRLGGPPTYDDYLDGHIPGARWVDLDADLADPPGPSGRHPLPDPARLQTRLRELGIDDVCPVVVYDDAGAASAARAWWVLRWAGLRDVRVLDGGLGAWIASGGALERGPAQAPRPGTVTVRPGAMPTLDAAGAARLAREGVLLDGRVAERYRGDIEPVDPVAGHIPGARSAPTAGHLADDGRFMPADQLQRHFAELGVRPGVAVGAYCGSGVTAAQVVLALEVAGVSAALYPGSWSAWITDPDRPVATGDGN